MVYEWKFAYLKTDANVAGRVCEDLKNSVGLTAENLVDASRPEGAPLHNEFEWDDGIAAEEWRKEQARYIIRHLTVKIDEVKAEPVRAFFSIKSEDDNKCKYEPIIEILKDKGKTNSLLDMALNEMIAFKRKYKMLRELANVFDAIDKVIEQLEIERGEKDGRPE